MALSLGATTPTALYLGTTAISAAYLGATQVYSTGGGDAYAIGGASPELVAAFTTQSDGTTAGEYYRKASSETTFGDLFTHSVSGLLTMFDSSGTLVWAPHNLMDGSHNFDNETYWFSSNLTEAAATTDGPDGSTKMWALTDADGANYGQLSDVGNVAFPSTATAHVCEFWLTKDEDETRFPCMSVNGTNDFFIHINTKTGAHVFEWNTASATASVTEAVTGLWRVRVTFQARGASDIVMFPARGTVIGTPSAAATGTAEFGFLTFYRADLPMADNPDMPAGLEKYVPTTSAAVYLSRRNAYYYDSGVLTKGGLQIESAAATNLLPYSQDFTNGAWTKVAATASLLSGDVYEITESGSGSQTPYLIDFVTIASGAAHVISIDVKDVDRGYAFLQWTDAASRFAINVDLSDGAITDTDTVATPDVLGYGSMTFGDGWYRLWIAATSASTSGYLVFGPSDSATPSWTGSSVPAYSVSGAKILARRAQLEPGSIPTSYIPTTGSTVTRAAETLTRNGAASAFGATEVTIAWDTLLTSDGGGPLTFDITKSANEFFRVYPRSAASTYSQYFGDGGPPDYSATVTSAQGGTIPAGVNQAYAGAYGIKASDEAQLVINGNAGTAVSTTTIENFDGLDMTILKTEGGIFIRTYREWSTKLPEADLVTAGTAS